MEPFGGQRMLTGVLAADAELAGALASPERVAGEYMPATRYVVERRSHEILNDLDQIEIQLVLILE